MSKHCDTRSPEKIQIDTELALQIEEWVRANGPIQTTPVRATTKEDMRPATFTIQKRR